MNTPQAFVSSSAAALPSSASSQWASNRLCRTPPPRVASLRMADESTSNTATTETPAKSKKPGPLKTLAGWGNEIFPGFKSKGSGSRPHDLRPKSIRTHEHNAGICTACDGTGVTICSFCEGVEFFNPDGSLHVCPACDGKKEVECTVCFGTGKEIELEDNWWEKGIAALFEK